LNLGSFDVNVQSSVLFVCDSHTAGSNFRQSLRETGLRLISGRCTEGAILSSTEPFDGILVYYEDLQVSSAVASRLKTLFPHTPVVLISIGDEVVPSSGIDAVCYTNSLEAEMARIIAMLFRDLLIPEPHPANVRLEHQDEYPRLAVLQPR
jgi:hypothetical protein